MTTADERHGAPDPRARRALAADRPSPATVRWGGSSIRRRLAGQPGEVHWIEFAAAEASDSARPVVLVHGLGGSHLSWPLLARELSDQRRVVCPDLYGFGQSDHVSSAIATNVDLVDALLDEIGTPVHLAGNSMGGMISAHVAARSPHKLASVTLIDAVMPMAAHRPDPTFMAAFLLANSPGLGPWMMSRMRRRPARARINEGHAMTYADRARVDPELLDAQVELQEMRDRDDLADVSHVEASRSLARISGLGRRAYAEMLAGIEVPLLLIQGDRDRLVAPGLAARMVRRHRHWRSVILPGVGHTPQEEAPGETAAAMRPFLHTHDVAEEQPRSSNE